MSRIQNSADLNGATQPFLHGKAAPQKSIRKGFPFHRFVCQEVELLPCRAHPLHLRERRDQGPLCGGRQRIYRRTNLG